MVFKKEGLEFDYDDEVFFLEFGIMLDELFVDEQFFFWVILKVIIFFFFK